MSVSVLNIFVVCGLFINFNEAARILAVFPVPSISHQVVFRPLTQELARRGHEVTVITPDPVFKNGRPPPNLTEIDVHDVSYNIWKESFIKAASKGVKDDSYSQMEIIMSTFSRVFDAQLKIDVVQNLIEDKSKQFDLLLLEACVRPALVFSHIYKNVPVILVSSLGAAPGNYELIGASEHPILYPNLFRKRLYNLSFWEKIGELYEHYRIVKFFESNTVLENQVLRDNFGPEIPTVHELGNNVDMLFLNINPIFEGIRPVPQSVVYMGGLHQKPAKELPTLVLCGLLSNIYSKSLKSSDCPIINMAQSISNTSKILRAHYVQRASILTEVSLFKAAVTTYTRNIMRLYVKCNAAHLTQFVLDQPSYTSSVDCSCGYKNQHAYTFISVNIDKILCRGFDFMQEAIDDWITDEKLTSAKLKHYVKTNMYRTCQWTHLTSLIQATRTVPEL